MTLRSISRILLLSAFIPLSAVGAARAAGQDVGLSTMQGFAVGGGGGFEVYRFATAEAANIRQLSLLTLPWSARASLGPAILEVRGGYASARVERVAGDDITLSGPLDTEVQIGLPFNRGGIVANIAGVVVLPTGTESQTADQAVAAGALAADLFPFRIVNWGMGGGAGGSVSAARALNSGSVGLSVSYLTTREFEPIQDETTATPLTYRPGDMLQVRVAADRNVGSAGKATLSFAYEHYQSDEFDGVNVFGSGGRYQGMGSYAFAATARSSGIVYGGVLYREVGDYQDEGGGSVTSEVPAQGLILLGGGLRVPVRGAVLLPSVDSRIFRTEDDISGGHLTGLGAALELGISSGWMVIRSARFRYGNIHLLEDRESDIYGGELGVTVRFGGSAR